LPDVVAVQSIYNTPIVGAVAVRTTKQPQIQAAEAGSCLASHTISKDIANIAMDPVSATGIASSAIAFVQLAYSFLSALYTIHDGGRDVEYDEVAEVSKRMRELSEAMLRDLPTSAQSQADIALANLANQCYTLSVDISRRIQKTQARSRRMGDLLKATLKAVLSRNDIIRLQGNLDNCRAQLHLQYDVVQRYVHYTIAARHSTKREMQH
jgi:hypothetical protein